MFRPMAMTDDHISEFAAPMPGCSLIDKDNAKYCTNENNQQYNFIICYA